jgi:hypothetical protein
MDGLATDFLEELKAVDLGHAEVGEKYVWPFLTTLGTGGAVLSFAAQVSDYGSP